MNLPPNKNIYFLSDFHLGAPNAVISLQREKRIVAFLESIKVDAAQIFIVGDMFDFWFEYKKVVPKGYVRLLGKLAELTDTGIQIHFFEFKTLDPIENYGQVYIRTDAIDNFYQTLLDNKTSIHPNGQLEIKPWGQKEFSVLDPDNNLLTFGQSS